jgi:hypothetical protein
MNQKILKNIIKILIISFVVLVFFLFIYFSIKAYKENNNNSENIALLSEANQIQSVLARYYLKYGKYPKAELDTTLNNNVLCDVGFLVDKKIKCKEEFSKFNNFVNIFIYKQNLDGKDYSIIFKSNYDNKYLNCTHDKKEKKQGCNFILTINGLQTIK